MLSEGQYIGTSMLVRLDPQGKDNGASHIHFYEGG